MTPWVSELWIYPVKSCRGIAVDSGSLDTWGFVHDREWMVVDASGRFVSQRTHARLASVDTSFESEALRLSGPHGPPLSVSLAPPTNGPGQVRVWRDDCAGWDAGDDAAVWFSTLLQERCRLVRRATTFRREVEPGFAAPGHQVGYADAYPLLLISQSSLDDLNRRLAQPLEMLRFRPNIVVEDTAPYAEDTWTDFRIGEVALRGVKPCKRCVITTRDPRTGESGPEPLKTLATYRRLGDGVIFGQNVVHEGRGTLRRGDLVRV